MSNIVQCKCDLCGNQLKDNEINNGKNIPLINLQTKPKSKNHLSFTFEGLTKSGDLCFACGRRIRDFMEDIKAGKK